MNGHIQNSLLVPTVIEKTSMGERSFDIFSRLHKERIIFLSDEVNSHTAAIIKAQLLVLAAEDPETDIYLYIDSPGGSVSAGLGIYDTMQFVKPDVGTICTGMAASMGAFLLCAGAPGKRFVLPNSEVMIHQPLGGAQGQCTEIEIAAEHIKRTRTKLETIMAEKSGQTLEAMHAACERDNYLTAEEAVAFGLVDKIITSSTEI